MTPGYGGSGVFVAQTADRRFGRVRDTYVADSPAAGGTTPPEPRIARLRVGMMQLPTAKTARPRRHPYVQP